MPFGEIPENLKDSGVSGLNMQFAPKIQPKKKPIPKIFNVGDQITMNSQQLASPKNVP